jgi:hypothetical protein
MAKSNSLVGKHWDSEVVPILMLAGIGIHKMHRLEQDYYRVSIDCGGCGEFNRLSVSMHPISRVVTFVRFWRA